MSNARVRFSAVSHVGKVRKVNEDSVATLPELGIWVVSDGMGGHDGGDYASQVVIDSISVLDVNRPAGTKLQSMRDSLHRAHEVIVAEAERRGGKTMGATVVALILADEHFACLWAGDSRLYRFKDGALDMLTSDHSLVASLVLNGQLTWDEAEKHPQSNAITRAVGVGEELELDKIRGETAPGDRFLLCSDELTKYADTRVLSDVLSRAPIETVADKLLNIALDGGGADNISIIVVDRL